MKKWAFVLAFALLFSFALAEETEVVMPETEETQLQSMDAEEEEPTLSVPEELVLNVGDKNKVLSIEFSSPIAKDKVVLTSSDPKIVSVSGKKLTVKAKKAAEVTIIATSTLSELTAYTHVRVVPKVKSVAFSSAALFLDAETMKNYTLSAKLLPEGAEGEIVYSSSNPSAIDVNATTGELEYKAGGTATITAKTGKLKATCRVTWMKLSEDTLTISGPEAVAVKTTVKYSYEKANADAAVTWSLENVTPKGAAKIDKNGKLTVSKSGSCTVVASLNDGSGVTAKQNVLCTAKAKKVIITRDDTGAKLSSVTMTLGGETQSIPVLAQVSPVSASQNVEWTTTDAAVAVYEEGAIVANGVGKCTLTATAQDGSKVKASVKVTVKELCENFIVTAKEFQFGGEGGEEYHAYVGKGKKLALTAKNSNSGSPVEVTWAIASDAKGYIKVDSKGVVTGLKITEGFDAKVIATLQDGTERTQTVHIEVMPLTKKLSLTTQDTEIANSVYTWDKSDIAERLSSITLYEQFDSDAVYPFCQWTTTDAEIAQIEYDRINHCCVVTFPNTKAGKAVVTAAAMDGSGKKVSVTFNVTAELHFDYYSEEIDIAKGKTVNIVPPYNADATDQQLFWVTEDEQTAIKIISETEGGLKAVGEVGDTAKVYVQSNNQNEKTFTYTVHITKKVSSFNIVSDAQTVLTKDTMLLSTDKAQGSTDNITWTSSNEAVATVKALSNGTCVVTGVAPGEATITATLEDGSKVCANTTITVTE